MESDRLGTFKTIGSHLDLTSVQVGKYLIDMGYRVKEAKGIKPTNKAYNDGLAVSQTANVGKQFFQVTKWHINKTVDAIKSHLEGKSHRSPVPKMDKKALSKMVTVIDGITSQSPTLPVSKFEYATFQFPRFNPVQTALLPYIEQDINLIVCSSTASGKTTVAEMCISYEVIENGKIGIFVGPLKALTSEKYIDWTDPKHCFSLFNISQCSGDYQITQKRIRELDEADIISITPEMVSARCRNIESEKSHFLQNTGCIVFDEAHLLTCYGRGDGVETAMIQLSDVNPNIRFVLLSGTMNNGEEIAEWVSSLNGKKTILIKSDYRPITIKEDFVTFEKKGYYDKKSGKYKSASYKQTEATKVETALKVYQENKDDKHLIFFHTKATQRNALKVFQDAGVNCKIFNADVDRETRDSLIEEFCSNREDGVRCLLSSSSLAWGINAPAKRVIIVGTTRGMEEVEVFDLQQECGRAGRPKYDTEGYCTFIVSEKDLYDLQTKLAAGTVVESTFATSRTNTDEELNTKVENTIAFHAIAEVEKGNDTHDKLEGWFKRTLAYHQQGDDAMKRIASVVRSMIKADLIRESGEKYKITPLGRIAAQLYYEPFSVVSFYRNMNAITDQGKNIRLSDADYAYIIANSHQYLDMFMSNADQENFDKDIGEAYQYTWLQDRLMKTFYAYYKILQGQTDGYFGALQSNLMQDGERTCAVLKAIDGYYHVGLGNEIDILSARIRHGVQRHLVSHVRIGGIGRIRANKLYNAGIRSFDDIMNATPDDIRTALDININIDTIQDWKNQARILNQESDV